MFQPSTNWMSRQFPCDVKVVYSERPSLVFDCEAKKLQKVPDGITSNASVLTLAKNNLQQIPGNGFSHLEDLTELNLYQAKSMGLRTSIYFLGCEGPAVVLVFAIVK